MAPQIDLIVASYNMHKAVGADRRRDPARTSAVIAEIGADIVAMQEADLRFGTKAGLLDLEALRREQGLVPVPVDTEGEAHGFHGNLLLVRDAIIERVQQLGLPGLEPRGALMTDLLIKGRPLRVIAAHFGLLPSSRTRQARAILERLQALDVRPTLLMGDLNEWRVGVRSSLSPLLAQFEHPATVRSFPARYPVVSLDRIMACTLGELSDVATHKTALSRVASDHLPIKARLRLHGSDAAGRGVKSS